MTASRNQTPPRVLITGASSGLGREAAIQLARRGCPLALVARREDKLADTVALVREAYGDRDVQCLSLNGDVTVMRDVRRHYAEIKNELGGLDWAILNAGIGESNNAREFKAALCNWVFSVNIGGVANWLEAVIPDMVAAGHGTIAGISSLASFRGLPDSGPYSASKAALNTLLESVRVDLRGTGVRVVTVCPGFVKSEITDRNVGGMPFLLDLDDGVRRMLRGIERGKRLVHFPWQLSRVVVHILRPMPAWLYEALIPRFTMRAKRPSRAAREILDRDAAEAAELAAEVEAAVTTAGDHTDSKPDT